MEKKSLILAFSIILLLSFYLTYLFVSAERPAIDYSINEWANSIQNSPIIAVSKITACLFDPIVLSGIGIIIAIYLNIKKEKKKSLALSSAIITSAITLKIMKELFSLERPPNMLVNETGYSFPSGHSAMAIVLLGMLILIFYKKIKHKKLAIIFSAIFALLIGLNRILLNAHWVTDIFGGYLFGALIISLAALIFPKNVL